jgi:hypothetical protein
MGLIPNRGRWEQELFDTLSTATFKQGSLVKLGAARTVSEYSGGEASFLGIALSNSTASLPAGKVLVAIPTSPSCKSGNTVSLVTTSFTSTGGKIAVIRGPIILSPTSRIECSFIDAGNVFASSASQTIA